LYEQALTNDPTAADALVGIARADSEHNKGDEAIARIQAQIAKVPNQGNFYYLLGVVLSDKKDYGGAETAIKKSIELDKTNSDALLKLGQVQIAAGNTDQAISTYEKSVQSNPTDSRFYVLLGEMYESKQQFPQARQMYQKALQVQPDNALAKNNLAYRMLEEGGNVDLALAMAQEARRGMPDSPNSADTLGWAYYEKGIYASAINLFEESLKDARKGDQPEDALTYYHLGLAYQKNGQKDLSRTTLQKALKLNPKFPGAEGARQALVQ
jgi:tetratricopeptide (TPR) repeat protein